MGGCVDTSKLDAILADTLVIPHSLDCVHGHLHVAEQHWEKW
jgi:hypothetical protein